MKKVLVMLIIMTTVITTAACGNQSSNNATAQNQLSSSPEVTSDSVVNNENLQEDGYSEPASGNDDALSGGQNGTYSVENDKNVSEKQGSNILVAYFSRVGNTVWEDGVDAVTSASLNIENDEYVGNAEYLARMAAEVTGGDLFLIQTEETYPSDYRETTDVAATEQDNDSRPVLASHVENMAQYNTVVLIYPNWWGTLPQPLFTFLEEYDFSGKTILPLCTHGGSRMGSSEKDIASLCPDAELLEGLAVSGSQASTAQSDVEDWINDSGILE